MNLIKYILKLIVGLGMLFCSVLLILIFLISLGGVSQEEFEEIRDGVYLLICGTLGFGGLTFYFFAIDYHYKVYKEDEKEQKNKK